VDFLTRYYGKFLAKTAYLHINALNIFDRIHPLVYDKLLVIYIAINSNKFYLLNLKLRATCFDRQ